MKHAKDKEQILMILRTPSYYDSFHCIADKCTDNCCIGWEIDIDEYTAEKYSSVKGDFGKRLSASISHENPSFITDENGRCPFLNKDNLCDIILNLGESALCDICTNHPRYFEWFGNVKEGGIGLSCEEAARIILTQKFSVSEREISDEETDSPDDESAFEFLYMAREKIISHLLDENVPLASAICDVIKYADNLENSVDSEKFILPEIEKGQEVFSPDIKDLLCFLLTLEQLCPDWAPYISSAVEIFSEREIFAPETDGYLRNIAVYFIWRYFMKSVYDGEISPKINLMAISVAVLSFLFSYGGDFSVDACSLIAKNFSKEIEYSEENLYALLHKNFHL